MSNPDVLIIGAGLSGLYLLHKLRAAGLTAIAVDAAPDLGGTWDQNRYPGCRCDVESLEYGFTFSQALRDGWNWSERYAAQPEILRYCHWVADQLDLRRDMIFDTAITQAHWDSATARWDVASLDGKTWRPRNVILATGALSVAKTPDIPGLDMFKGPVLQTTNWPRTPVDVSGRRVGLIGTGSSGIQVATALAGEAGHLSIFQRTPSYAVEARNRPLTDDDRAAFRGDFASLDAWARQSNSGLMIGPAKGDAQDFTPDRQQEILWEAWNKGGFHIGACFTNTGRDPEANAVVADFVRARIREKVADPDTAALLCPDDFIGTRRMCVDTGYFEIFNRDTVTLVDVKSDPITKANAAGLQLSSGALHELDILVLATGYDALTGAITRIDLRGADGQSVQDAWSAGPKTLYGLAMAGFPNLFTMTGPGSPAPLTNLIRSIEHHGDWITDCLCFMRDNDIAAMSPTSAAQNTWMDHCAKVASNTLFTRAKSWYMGSNIPGKPQMFMAYAGGLPSYIECCAAEARSGYPGFSRHARS